MKRVIGSCFALILVVSACGERLDNIVGCPALCPQDVVNIQTVIIEPVSLDTTVQTPVALGNLPLMLLANRGDTLDTRVVVRFDTVPDRYIDNLASIDSIPIEEIHDAVLRLRISTFEGKLADSTTIEVFNVDTTAADTDFTALLALFRPDRQIGGGTFAEEDLVDVDSVRVPLSGEALLPIIHSAHRLRVGLRVSGPAAVQFHVFSTESGLSAVLSYRPAADTTVPYVFLVPQSRTPDAPAELRANLADFVIFAQVPPIGAPTDLNVGGLPAQRSYLRFVLPPEIIDSSTVVRATLLLTQRPNRVFGASDTLAIAVNLGLAGIAVTDLARAALLVGDPVLTGVDTLYTVPSDSGERAVDIVNFVRFWASVSAAETPHAVVLTSTRENGSPLEANFFSSEAAPELRPRLRISFAARPPVGLP